MSLELALSAVTPPRAQLNMFNVLAAAPIFTSYPGHASVRPCQPRSQPRSFRTKLRRFQSSGIYISRLSSTSPTQQFAYVQVSEEAGELLLYLCVYVAVDVSLLKAPNQANSKYGKA